MFDNTVECRSENIAVPTNSIKGFARILFYFKYVASCKDGNKNRQKISKSRLWNTFRITPEGNEIKDFNIGFSFYQESNKKFGM